MKKKYDWGRKVENIYLSYFYFRTQGVLNEQYQKVLLKIYDRGLKLKCNPCDTNDERWWSLEYDFQYDVGNHYALLIKFVLSIMYFFNRKITGTPSQNDELSDEYMETRFLATSLKLSRERRTDLMLHPLVQIFIAEKYKKYKWLIKASILYHVSISFKHSIVIIS